MVNHTLEFAPLPNDCTKELQAAIDRSVKEGLRLVLLRGHHHCCGLQLKSNLDLYFEEGAILNLTAGYELYADNRVGVIAEASDRGMLVARNEKAISITGRGRIEANGEAYIVGALEEMGTHIPAEKRPRTLIFENCSDITLSDFFILNSPMWTIHLIGSDGINIQKLSVDNDRKMPNTDGIVIDACRNVTVTGCNIATADDGVVLKTSAVGDGFAPVGDCRDIEVSACNIESHSCALKIGTETFGAFETIRFKDCSLTHCNRAVGIFSRDGGLIRDVSFERISVDCHETPEGFWGSGEAITVNCIDRRNSRRAGAIETILFSQITGRMEGAINLVADSLSGIREVTCRDIDLQQDVGAFPAAQYDVRPTHFDLAPSPDAAGRANAWVKDDAGNVIGLVAYPGGQPGLFASNIEGLSLQNVSIKRPQIRPETWNEEPIVIVENEPVRWS